MVINSIERIYLIKQNNNSAQLVFRLIVQIFNNQMRCHALGKGNVEKIFQCLEMQIGGKSWGDLFSAVYRYRKMVGLFKSYTVKLQSGRGHTLNRRSLW